MLALLQSTVMVNSENNIHEVFMEKQSSDLDSSASGYIYRQDGHAPANIVYFNSGGSDIIKPYSSAQFPFISGANTHRHYVQPKPYNPQVIYHHPTIYTKPLVYAQHHGAYVNKPIPYAYQHKHVAAPDHEAYVSEAAAVEDDDDDEDEAEEEEEVSHAHYSHLPVAHAKHTADHGHHEESDGYAKEDGSDYGEEHNSKHGNEASKGYKNEHEFDKGEKGHHHDENHADHYNKHGGKKSSEYDEGASYDQHEEGEKGSKGGKFGEKKSHKKGSKTTGYHNVFHKDEYKKDHTFYDDADHSGNFHKYGNEHAYHKADAGKHGKGGYHDSAHYADHFGKKGHTDKGHYDTADAGYNKKHGHDQHFAHESDYAKKGGNQYGNEHGYRQSGHH